MNASTRNYTRVSALVFTVVALLQGWRAASGLALRIEGGSVSGPADDGCGHRPRARFGDEAATDDPVGE